MAAHVVYASRRLPCRIDVEHHGSVVLLRPFGRAALAWLRRNVAAEPWQWIDSALAVEPCMAAGILKGWAGR